MKFRTGIALVLVLAIAAAVFPAFQTEGEETNVSSSMMIAAAPSARDELETRIRSKSQELDSLNRELYAKQQELLTAKTERATLQRELSKLETNIAFLKLSIKNDELTAEKLGYEIDSLSYDIKDIEQSVARKRLAVGKLVAELNRRDETTPLVVFLKYRDIGEAIAEAEALTGIKNQLRQDTEGLLALKENLRNKLSQVTERKEEIDLRKKTQIAKQAIVEDQKQTRKAVLAETQSKESIFEKQVAELEKQQNALEDEIDAIEDKLRAEFDPSLAPSKRGGVFLWPLKLITEGGKGRITQHYGERSYLYRGKPHNGLDIGAPVGTPVFAAEDGFVTAVDNNDRSNRLKYQYGKYILIRHNNNLSTLYAHLSKQSVAVGQSVKRGELIGYSGSTGYATGPHLHFGAYWTASIQMKAIPPAAGLVPVGVTLSPEDYL